MPSISSTTGLVSGIDTKSIIDQLVALESRPKTRLQARIETENKKKAAYTDLQTRLTTIRLFGTSMKKPQSFRNASVASTDEKVLTGTASSGAAAGSYTMSVARLVSSRQSITKGFKDASETPVGAGTLTLELGGGDLDTPTALDDLNGGAGVRRGMFRITDRSGQTAIIDTSDAVTLDDVLKKINTSLDVSVKAIVKNDAIVMTDQTGATTNNFRIQDVGDGHAAEDLGISQNVAADTVNGTVIAGLKSTTLLAGLNDGRGVSIKGANADDFSIAYNSGAGSVNVSLTGATTVGDVVTKINTALGSNGNAEIANGGLRIVDAGGGTIEITELNTSTASTDLGIAGTGTGSITGRAVSAGIDTTLVSSLRGGRGLDLGIINVTDRAGVSTAIDLTGAGTVEAILTRINDAAVGVQASVKSGGNGITLTDSSGSGNLVITDSTGTGAAQLGIAGTFAADAAHKTISGANLQKAWFSRDTLLRDLNGGKGVTDGTFKITDSAGKTRNVTLDTKTAATVGDVMDKINAGTGFGVKATINENGDGLLLTDSAGGSLKMKVDEVNNGSVAKALNIAGTAATTALNGSWEKTVTVSATDKLQDVQTKITNAGWGLSAAIINDGSDDAPYRLSLTSTATGRAGRVVFDSGALNLGERVLVDAQDAAVFVGTDDTTGGSGGQPMLITANSNTISGAIRGVTLNLTGVSKEPVTVNVARNVDNVVEATGKFIENFNGLIAQIKTYTKFDSQTQTRGELLGDNAASSIESELYGMINTVGRTTGKYRIAADIGIRVGDGGSIEFDEEKFRAAYADDPDAVTDLFTRSGAAIDDDFQLSGLRNNQGLRTNPTGTPDFAITTKDNTNFNVDASDLTTMGQLIDAINNAAGNNGKVTASINTLGTGIDLSDKSATGTKKFQVSTMNGSIAASDLGLLTTAANGKITGRTIVNQNVGDSGGIASIIEKRINRLIDPTIGVVTRASKDVDTRNDDFNDRIATVDKIVAAKRERLEKQFANMEASLSKLQSQQSALNSYTPVSFG